MQAVIVDVFCQNNLAHTVHFSFARSRPENDFVRFQGVIGLERTSEIRDRRAGSVMVVSARLAKAVGRIFTPFLRLYAESKALFQRHLGPIVGENYSILAPLDSRLSRRRTRFAKGT